jgi:hypothetical protein
MHSYFKETDLICVGFSSVKNSRPESGTEDERYGEPDERSIEGSSRRILTFTIFRFENARQRMLTRQEESKVEK